MKKSTAIIISLATIVNVGLWFISNDKEEDKAATKQGIIFENDKVAIKYFDSDSGNYDILVETRNGTNITSEWDLKPAQNDSFAYLIGRDKSTAKEYFDKNLKDRGYTWNWEENYPIEGLDVPYSLPK